MVGLDKNNSPAGGDKVRATFRRRLFRAFRRILTGTLLVLAVLVLLVSVVFLLPPLRGSLAAWSVRFADEALPGSISVGEVDWPSMGHLVLRDVLWVAGTNAAPGDTLGDVAHLDLQLDLEALRHRDGRVKSLNLYMRRLDVPAIVAATASPGNDAAADSLASETVPAEVPYFHPGSIPGFPSATLDDLDLEIARLGLEPGVEIRDLVLSGSADAGRGHFSGVVVEHAEGRFLTALGDTAGAPIWEWELEHLGLGLEFLIGRNEEYAWILSSAGLDSLNIVVAPPGGTAPADITGSPERASLQGKAHVQKAGPRYDGGMDCEFVLPGSARFRPWLPDDFPHEEFGTVSGRLLLTGTFSDPQVRCNLRLDLGSSIWLDQGVIVGSAEADLWDLRDHGLGQLTARLDTLDIDLQGIRLDGSGDWGPEEGDLDLSVACTDFRLPLLFAAAIDPALGEALLASDQMLVDGAAHIKRKGNRFSGGVDGHFELPGTATFGSLLPEDFPHEEFPMVAGNLQLAATFSDPQVRCNLRLDLGSSTWLDQGVIVGSAEADLRDLRDHGLGQLTARLDTVDIEVPGIRLDGSGDWGPEEADLDLSVACTDFRLPLLFADAVDPALREALLASDQVVLDAAARINRTGTKFSGGLDGHFELPGTAAFGSWLPEDFPHEVFDSLSGNLELSGNYEDPHADGEFRLDFTSNSWAEKGVISGSAATDLEDFGARGLPAVTARLDTCEIDAQGFRVSAAGALGPGTLDLEFDGAVESLQLVQLFAGPELAGTEAQLVIDAAVAGSLEDPRIDAHLAGGFQRGAILVPSFDFSLEGDRTYVRADLRAGEGMELEGVVLDSLSSRVNGKMAGPDSLSADFRLSAWQGNNRFALGGAVWGDPVRVVRLDSLVMVGFDKEIRNSAPATFTLGPGPRMFELTALEFEGDPGTIFAKGHNNQEGMELEAVVDLLLQEELLQQFLPSPLWSMRGGGDLKIDFTAGMERGVGESSVDGRGKVLLIPHRDEPAVGLDMNFHSQGGANAHLNGDMNVSSGDTVLLAAMVAWPGLAGPHEGFWRPDPQQEMILTLPPQKMNLELINDRLPSETALHGHFDLAVDIRVFPPGRGEEPDSLAVVPLRGSVEGKLGIPHLKIDLPNRSWIEMGVDARASGSLADPKVEARIDVTSGFIRLPEIPRNLHPLEGPSLLWALNDSLLAVMDSTAADSTGMAVGTARNDSLLLFHQAELVGPRLNPSGPAVLPEMDLEVVISNDLRIIGYSLDAKVLGALKVVRGYDKDRRPGPSITGDVSVREGSLKVMNHVFNVERGNINFAGDVPPNPNLNLTLECQVNAYLIRILISGRSATPLIELTSEPDLSEEDVMAVLLFGQPLGDLDSDQRGRMQDDNDPSKELQKNLAGLAMALGTKGLQDTMNDSFGVDVMQMGSDSSGGSTLMVGKFITPDIMLKYHQSLEKSGTYFMTLEYSLNRFFKVISTYGQGEEASGAELQWSKRY